MTMFPIPLNRKSDTEVVKRLMRIHTSFPKFSVPMYVTELSVTVVRKNILKTAGTETEKKSNPSSRHLKLDSRDVSRTKVSK